MTRESEIAHGLESVRARIDSACAAAGRQRDEITLVVVTKFFPASDVRLLADLGVSAVDLGELLDEEDDLYPDEVLSDVARQLGFGELFDEAVGLASA